MPIALTLTSTAHVEAARLQRMRRKAPGEFADALNHLAHIIRKEEHAAMIQHIDRPTKFTTDALWVIQAKARKLEAKVHVRWRTWNHLGFIVYGETEHAPKSHLPIRPSPAREGAISHDAHGNIPRRALASVRNSKHSFVGIPKGRTGPYGIWRRAKVKRSFAYAKAQGSKPRQKWKGSMLQLVAVLVTHFKHRATYPFYDVANKAEAANWRRVWDRAFDRAGM